MRSLITIVGPTAVGKTALSLRLAKHFACPILSADSRQFYRDMNIGTAKPTAEELSQVPHHFINSLGIQEDFSAGRFEQAAEALMEKLFVDHDVLIMVGGSTLYMDAIWHGFDEMPTIDPEVRQKLNNDLEALGLVSLLNELQAVDPKTYEKIDRQNPARVIRALEVFRGSQLTISHWRQGRSAKSHS